MVFIADMWMWIDITSDRTEEREPGKLGDTERRLVRFTKFPELFCEMVEWLDWAIMTV